VQASINRVTCSINVLTAIFQAHYPLRWRSVDGCATGRPTFGRSDLSIGFAGDTTLCIKNDVRLWRLSVFAREVADDQSYNRRCALVVQIFDQLTSHPSSVVWHELSRRRTIRECVLVHHCFCQV
jgi:hypothetical protein